MTQEHPITPPPELIQQWLSEEYKRGLTADHVAIQAARWGSDQELEACCEWLKFEGHEYEHEALLVARRPKRPSLREQALEALAHILNNSSTQLGADTIRRALEQLSD